METCLAVLVEKTRLLYTSRRSVATEVTAEQQLRFSSMTNWA